MKSTVYIAYLKGGRMYVGSTHDFKQRKWEHFHHQGSHVTKKYPPISIQPALIVNSRYAKLAEIYLTKKLLRKYGPHKVAGPHHEHAWILN
jgi:predicted GIY-YIG superfamily endonuclease